MSEERDLVVKFDCPICKRTFEVPARQVWVPRFKDVQRVVETGDSRFALLLETFEINGATKTRGRRICAKDAKPLYEIGIQIDPLSVLITRARERREREAQELKQKRQRMMTSIGDMLGGEKVAEIKAAVVDEAEEEMSAEAKPRRTRSKAKKAGESGSKGRKPSTSKGRSKSKVQAEINEAQNE